MPRSQSVQLPPIARWGKENSSITKSPKKKFAKHPSLMDIAEIATMERERMLTGKETENGKGKSS